MRLSSQQRGEGKTKFVSMEDKRAGGKIKSVSLSHLKISPQVVKLIPERLAQQFVFLVIDKRENVLTLAMADPTDIITIDVVSRITGCELNLSRSPVKISWKQ